MKTLLRIKRPARYATAAAHGNLNAKRCTICPAVGAAYVGDVLYCGYHAVQVQMKARVK